MTVRCSNGVPFLVLEPEPSIRTGIRVDIFDGDDPATLLGTLPDTWGRRWTDPLKGTGSGEFQVSADHPELIANPSLLDYGNIFRFSLDEVYRFACVIEAKDKTQVRTGGDVARTLKVQGRGLLAKLEDAQLYPLGGLAGDPVRVFTGQNAGEIMSDAVGEAKTRGGLVGIIQDYTTAVDSNNAPYAATLTLDERAGTSVLRIAERIAELAADVYMTPAAELRIVNERGIDRSQQLPNAGPVILQPADNLDELTRSESGAIKNTLLIETPAGFLERSEGSSITTYGRREAFLSLGNMTDGSAIDRASDAVFEQSANPAAEIGAQVQDRDGARPYVDWGVGDWVLAPDENDEEERVRVRALTVSEDDEGNPIFVPELATITEELEARLERWLAAMSKGTVGGTAGSVAEPVQAPVEVIEAIDAGIGDHLAGQPHHDELGDLSDVDLTGLQAGDGISYDGADWTATRPRTSYAAFSITGDLAVATGSHPFIFTRAATIVSVRAGVGTAPTGAAVIVDVNRNGTTIFTTQANRPEIAASATDSGNETPDVTALSAGDALTVDVDAVGSGDPGSNLTVVVEFY